MKQTEFQISQCVRHFESYAKDLILNRKLLLTEAEIFIYVELLVVHVEPALTEKPSVTIHCSRHPLLDRNKQLYSHRTVITTDKHSLSHTDTHASSSWIKRDRRRRFLPLFLPGWMFPNKHQIRPRYVGKQIPQHSMQISRQSEDSQQASMMPQSMSQGQLQSSPSSSVQQQQQQQASDVQAPHEACATIMLQSVRNSQNRQAKMQWTQQSGSKCQKQSRLNMCQ